MYTILCAMLVKCILTRRGGSKSSYINYSQRPGFSDSELPGKIVGKSRKHVLWCASVSRNITPAGHVPAIDSVPSIRSNTLIRSPSVMYQRILPIREAPPVYRTPSEHPIDHLGAKDLSLKLSRTRGSEHYLVYGRPNQIPNLLGKTDHNVGGLACILGLINSYNQSP